MRKFLVVILLAAFCSVLRSSAGSEPDGGKADLKAMEGAWTVDRIERGGKPFPANDVPANDDDSFSVRIEGDRLTLIATIGKSSWVFEKGTKLKSVFVITLDAAKKPKTLNLKQGEQTLGCIYAVKDDTLAICCFAGGKDGESRPEVKNVDFKTGLFEFDFGGKAGERPTDFKCAEKRHFVVFFKRSKP